MRIRTIKPEFWSHPVIGPLDDSIKLLAIGLLNYADDEGFFYAEPRLIRAALRPFDDESTMIRRSIVELSRIGYLTVRKHPTHGDLGYIVNFTKHQRIDRPKPSTIKDLYNSTTNRRSIDDESLLEGKGREQGMEGSGGEGSPPPSVVPLAPERENGKEPEPVREHPHVDDPEYSATTNKPTLGMAIRYFAKLEGADYEEDEVKQCWLSFESTKAPDGSWRWGRSLITDWRSAMMQRMNETRQRFPDRPRARSANRIIQEIRNVRCDV